MKEQEINYGRKIYFCVDIKLLYRFYLLQENNFYLFNINFDSV